MSDNARGVIAMIVATAAFNFNDTLMKLVLQALPLGQAMVLRGLASMVLCYFLLRGIGAFGRIRDLKHPMVLLRTGFECGAMIFFMIALAHISIATLTATLQALPLIATALAAIFLGEPVGWRRWMATIIGLIGVMVVIGPFEAGGGFEPIAFLGLAAAFFAAARDLATRFAPVETPSLLLAFSIIIGGVVTGVGVSVVDSLNGDGWRAVSLRDTGLIGVASISLIIAHHFVSRAMRFGEMAVVAPFRYVAVFWAILWSWLIFNDPPTGTDLIGVAIVIAAGLYTLHREQTVRRRLRAEAAKAAAARPADHSVETGA